MGHVVACIETIFHREGHLQIVEVIGHLLVLISGLAAFLGVEQARLKEERCAVGERLSHHGTDVEARLPFAAIQGLVVRVDHRERRSYAQAIIAFARLIHPRRSVLVIVEMSCLRVIIFALSVSLC